MAAGDNLRIAGVVALYFAVSITLVFANKILMPSGTAKSDDDIDAPLFVTWFQCLLTSLIIWCCGRLAANARPDSWLKEFPLGAQRSRCSARSQSGCEPPLADRCVLLVLCSGAEPQGGVERGSPVPDVPVHDRLQ
jgi:hypothetical protein